jgi:hypothetical protein
VIDTRDFAQAPAHMPGQEPIDLMGRSAVGVADRPDAGAKAFHEEAIVEIWNG